MMTGTRESEWVGRSLGRCKNLGGCKILGGYMLSNGRVKKSESGIMLEKQYFSS